MGVESIMERLANRDPEFYVALDDVCRELASRLPEQPSAADLDRVLCQMEAERGMRPARSEP